MRNTIAAAVFLIAFSASAGTITSIDHPTIVADSGEYFMTVTGTGLGDRFLYDGPTGRTIVEVGADDGLGHVVAWIPLEIVNTSGTYSLSVLGGTGDTQPVTFRVLRPGRPKLSLHLPDVLLALAKTRLGTGIKYNVSVTGGEGQPTVNCDPVSGSTFPFGSSWIKCIATDLAGDRATGEIQVNVWDGVAPKITLPTSFEVESEDERGAFPKFEVSAYDDIDGELKPVCSNESGSFFPNGRTVVNCEAIDESLNPVSGSFEVMVRPRDPGKLGLKVPDDIYVTSDNGFEAIVEYTVEAYGSADPDPVIECSVASGSAFSIGDTKVYCIATDDFDNRAEGGFVVVVKDGGLGMKDVTVEATTEEGASASFEAAPEFTETLKCSHESGAFFAMGTTAVTCESGKRSSRFNVIVADTVAPHIGRVRTIARDADAEQRVAVDVEVESLDAADAMPRCSVYSIEGGEGRVTSDLSVSLRGDRENAREFRLQVSCVDKAGNRATETVPVRLSPAGRRQVINN